MAQLEAPLGVGDRPVRHRIGGIEGSLAKGGPGYGDHGGTGGGPARQVHHLALKPARPRESQGGATAARHLRPGHGDLLEQEAGREDFHLEAAEPGRGKPESTFRVGPHGGAGVGRRPDEGSGHGFALGRVEDPSGECHRLAQREGAFRSSGQGLQGQNRLAPVRRQPARPERARGGKEQPQAPLAVGLGSRPGLLPELDHRPGDRLASPGDHAHGL